jgi:predicted dinucleotide-binding enzyme
VKIGVLGTGRVGQALGQGWLAAGHEVTFGTRQDPQQRCQALTELFGHPVTTLTQSQCIAQSEALVLAMPWPAAQELIVQIPADRRPILIDCLNPLTPDLSGLAVPAGSSTAEILQDSAPHAAVVKAFNCASSGTLADPSYPGTTPTMLFCGNDEAAKEIVKSLIEEIGFEGIDVGDLSMAHHLESLALLTIKMSIKHRWGANCALKVLTRSPEN